MCKWVATAFAGSVLTPEQFAALASARTITTSTAFSGIGCSETADEVVAGGCQQILGELNAGDHDLGALPLCFEFEFAIVEGSLPGRYSLPA